MILLGDILNVPYHSNCNVNANSEILIKCY